MQYGRFQWAMVVATLLLSLSLKHCLFAMCTASPDVIPSDWLGWKHRVTNQLNLPCARSMFFKLWRECRTGSRDTNNDTALEKCAVFFLMRQTGVWSKVNCCIWKYGENVALDPGTLTMTLHLKSVQLFSLWDGLECDQKWTAESGSMERMSHWIQGH